MSEVKAYYKDLLIIQYNNKPKALATVESMYDVFAMNELPLALRDAFDLETATGKQLDIIAKYAGVQRRNRTFTRFVNLEDGDFRQLIKVALAKNTSGSSLADIQNIINDFFQGELIVFDFKNMTIGYFFSASIGDRELAEIFATTSLLPKPMGVTLSSLIYVFNVTDMFGYVTYEKTEQINTVGLNDYDDVQDHVWLDYSDAIVLS